MLLPNWTLAPDGTVADTLTYGQYLEYRDSGQESYSTNNSFAKRVFIVDWADRNLFIDDLLGYSTVVGGTTISRVLPDPHPEILNFWADDAEVTGKGILGHADSGYISYTVAFVSCNYKPVDYPILADNAVTSELDRFVSKQFAFSNQYITTQGGMKFQSTGVILSNQPGFVIGEQELVYTWHDVPGLPTDPFIVPNESQISQYQGMVNSGTFDPNGGAYPVGTVLFMGCDPKMTMPKVSTNGVLHWEIMLKFGYKNNGTAHDGNPAGWNYVFDQANNRWDKQVSVASGQPIYQSGNLNQLFTI